MPDAPAEPRQPTDGAVSREQPSAVSTSTTTFVAIDRSAAGHSALNRVAADRVDAAITIRRHPQASIAASRHSVYVSVYLQFD